jgi:ABC-type multidrug transport system fused ATPase/permease subunit
MLKKSLFLIKSIVVILFISSYLIFMSRTFADDGSSSFTKRQNTIYQFMDDHDWVLISLSDMVAGGALCGFWCMAAGGFAGAIDEGLVYFGYTDKRYLTYGILGAAIGNMINSSLMYSGAMVGVLLPAGVFNEHQELVAPIVSAVSGYAESKTPGLIQGALGGAVDELAIYSGLTDKHYITAATVGATLANAFLHHRVIEFIEGAAGTGVPGRVFSQNLANFIGAAFSLIAVNYEEAFVNRFKGPAKVAQDLYHTYSKFIPQKQLDAHLEKHAISLLGGQLLSQLLVLKIIGYEQNLNYHFEHLNVVGGSWNAFGSEAIKIGVFLFPFAISGGVSGGIDNYFEQKLRFVLEDKVQSKIFCGENALRLSHHSNSSVLLDNLKNDITTAVGSGSSLITDAVSTSIKGAYGVGIIIVHSPDMFVYSLLYNQATLWVAEYLAAQHRGYGEKIKLLESDLIGMMKHDNKNVRTITERDGILFTRTKVQQISDALRENEGMQNLWGMTDRVWRRVTGFTDYVMNYYLVAKAINSREIDFNDRAKVQMANWQASNLLSWTGEHAQQIAIIDQSLDRVIILEGVLHTVPKSVDQITRVIQNDSQLVLHELQVGVGGRILVTVDELKFDMGKIYAVTGESGCGKSSLLSKIKGVKENGISGTGTIYYPRINGEDPKIVMLSQQDYFPLQCTLQEVLAYPDMVPNDSELNLAQREEMLKLLEEIGLHDFMDSKTTAEKLSLDSKKDWYTVLRGSRHLPHKSDTSAL